jgi:hypothetical protein
MSLDVVTVMHPKAPTDAVRQQEELVGRVASSLTLEKSPRLRAFFRHVCRCALEDKPEEATEQQIGIYVYRRPPGYNPNEDNIVRSQARVLRMKLEHHFANEGKDESVVITIPKGQYLPLFESRHAEPFPRLVIPVTAERKTRRFPWPLSGLAVLLGLLVLWLGFLAFRHRSANPPSASVQASSPSREARSEVDRQTKGPQAVSAAGPGEARIAAGQRGTSYVDVWGHRWDADRFYEGGVVRPGPVRFFPPVAEEGLFRSMREAASGDQMVPQSEREFHYNIPLSPGVYELKLYFADPFRQPVSEKVDDEENERHFHVEANGRPLLVDFDPIADAGNAPIDVRVFKDVRPSADGKLHLTFSSDWGRPAFVSAIELTPGVSGKLRPIRISARPLDFVDADGTRWSGDKYFINGRTHSFESPTTGSRTLGIYSGERHGNFSYAIPVAPGSYTVRLYFMESFFSPLVHLATCHGVGCRVFDVTCNGVMLLPDFDIFQAAGGAFRPVVREFHGLHPNGQGKLLLSFSPKVNYGEIRALEVIDEAN